MIYGLVWSVAFYLTNEQKTHFDQILKKLSNSVDKNLPQNLKDLFRKVKLPDQGTIFDYNLQI